MKESQNHTSTTQNTTFIGTEKTTLLLHYTYIIEYTEQRECIDSSKRKEMCVTHKVATISIAAYSSIPIKSREEKAVIFKSQNTMMLT